MLLDLNPLTIAIAESYAAAGTLKSIAAADRLRKTPGNSVEAQPQPLLPELEAAFAALPTGPLRESAAAFRWTTGNDLLAGRLLSAEIAGPDGSFRPTTSVWACSGN